ncbi:MAG: uroporphyrinogen-III C-methyltransferase [Armatimonadetes bacterium]|nr:uroporphyrinogen-III C-methyltransferase [Armatimonadota bacterium]
MSTSRYGGTVYLVGAGPGDPGLITVRGLRILRSADVVVYDRLVHSALLDEAPPGAERVFVGKHPAGPRCGQGEIHAILIARARAGLRVVRLKGGDPFVFGRGGEECEALRAAGVRFAVVPGVSAAIAVPAYAGIPVTDRRYASAFAIVTGHECDAASDLDWHALARIPTLVVLMGLRSLPSITRRLLASGRHARTPAAVVAIGTLPGQRTAEGDLGTIAERVRDVGLESPATLIVGDVVRLRAAIRWFDHGPETAGDPALAPVALGAATE